MADASSPSAIQIEIRPDGLSATLSFAAGEDDVTNLAALQAALGAHGVTVGVDDAALAAALAAGQAEHLVVATGSPAGDGKDAWLETLVPARDRTPQIDETDRMDFRDFGEILIVHPDTPLMRRHPATAGTPGRSVSGGEIPAKPGNACALPVCGDGAGVAREDPDLIVATTSGNPVIDGAGIRVEPVYVVKDVNIETGNIVFDGSVLVQGDVLAGMRVKAGGDIEVQGLVETATLEAGGDIVLHGGAVGGKEAGATLLSCGGSFSANHVQYVKVEAADSIYVNDVAMAAELHAGNSIVIGKDKRGLAIGGHLCAARLVSAKVLGAQTRIATLVEIGVGAQLHARVREIDELQAKAEELLLQVSRVLDLNDKQPGRIAPAMVEKARQTAAQTAKDIAARRVEKAAIERKIELVAQAQVICHQGFHEGVEIRFGEAKFKVQDEGRGAVFRLVEGEVKMLPPDQAIA